MRVSMRHGLAAIAACAVAACGSGESETTGPIKNSEVLAGSISDGMIAYDTLSSEPPPAKAVPEDGESAAGSAGSARTSAVSPATQQQETPSPTGPADEDGARSAD